MDEATLREYYAGQLLASLDADFLENSSTAAIAEYCFAAADAMVARAYLLRQERGQQHEPVVFVPPVPF
jgi:hypothetical protein